MKAMHSTFAVVTAMLLGATPALAQQNTSGKPSATDAKEPVTQTAATTDSGTATTAAKPVSTVPRIEIQHLRPVDQRGINVFEAPKHDGVPYEGFKLGWGAAFTQQFQGLSHSNTASPKMVSGVNANQLMEIGNGFNNAVANLYLNAQLAPGIRVAVTSYMSSRHHNEMWVKDGYFLIDDSPFEVPILQNLMKVLTLRVGHFEVNYGDAHFRRTDNGNAMYNPFVGNYIMDAFTTEIGAEAYLRKSGFLAMVGATGGEVRGQVTQPTKRAPSYLAKLGFDKQLQKDLRVRLTGSMYTTDKSVNNTLYSGDRAGSRYYSVMENTTATEAAQAWSGAIQPGFRSNVTAYVVNPFVKYHGLELFGNVEQAKGKAATEAADRKWNQYVGEAVYRFLPKEQLYVGARYNTAKGTLAGITNDVSVDRSQVGGGWFITPNIMLKGEYVTQKYKDFPTTDIRNGGKFKGFMVEGVVAF